MKEDKELFEQKMADEAASFSVTEIVPAAISGKIETLFLFIVVHSWGSYDSESHRIEMHEERLADSLCLSEMAARATFEQGGTIHLLERNQMPRPTANMNAIYRYK